LLLFRINRLTFAAVQLVVAVHFLYLTLDALFFLYVFFNLLLFFCLLPPLLLVHLVEELLFVTFFLLFVLKPRVFRGEMFLFRVGKLSFVAC
jgi:hypothetical protein